MQSGSHAIKLGMLGITADPYMTPKDAWDYNPSRWPDVSFPDICVYITGKSIVFPALGLPWVLYNDPRLIPEFPRLIDY